MPGITFIMSVYLEANAEVEATPGCNKKFPPSHIRLIQLYDSILKNLCVFK
jgi:hypothetical protein